MSYQFHGFFSDADGSAIEAACTRWPSCIIKSIETPFRGFGLMVPEMRDVLSDDEYERHLESVAAVEESVTMFSRDFPQSTFVYLEADCFGAFASTLAMLLRRVRHA